MFNVKLKVDPDGRGLTSIRTQIERPLILDTLAELRKAGPMRDIPGFGRWALSIPLEDMLALRIKYPDLASSDPFTKTRAYRRFIASDESIPYRVRERI